VKILTACGRQFFLERVNMCKEVKQPTIILSDQIRGIEDSSFEGELVQGTGIIQTDNGLKVLAEAQQGEQAEGMGPFDQVLIYEKSEIVGLTGDILISETPKCIRSLDEERDYAQEKLALDNITFLENSPKAKKDMAKYRKAYIANFVFGFLPVLKGFLGSFGEEETTVLAPQRGGEPIREMITAWHERGMFLNIEAPEFEAKRMFLEDGRSVVGITGLRPEEVSSNVAIIDDCLASMISARGVADCLVEAKKGESLNLALCFGFGYVKALGRLHKYLVSRMEANSQHKTQDLCLARNVYGANEAHYLTIAEHQKNKFPGCDQAVGDMGKAMNLFGEDGEGLRALIRQVVQGEMSFGEIGKMGQDLL
jgi:hypothetical protein